MNAAPRGKHGEASGVLAMARVIGQSLSVALVGAIFASGGAMAAGELSALQRTFLHSFRAALLTCAACAAIGIGTSLVRGHE